LLSKTIKDDALAFARAAMLVLENKGRVVEKANVRST
jgi:hypothetical protein